MNLWRTSWYWTHYRWYNCHLLNKPIYVYIKNIFIYIFKIFKHIIYVRQILMTSIILICISQTFCAYRCSFVCSGFVLIRVEPRQEKHSTIKMCFFNTQVSMTWLCCIIFIQNIMLAVSVKKKNNIYLLIKVKRQEEIYTLVYRHFKCKAENIYQYLRVFQPICG